jgi:hypothetical protein
MNNVATSPVVTRLWTVDVERWALIGCRRPEAVARRTASSRPGHIPPLAASDKSCGFSWRVSTVDAGVVAE